MNNTITNIVNDIPVVNIHVLLQTYSDVVGSLKDKTHIEEKLYLINYIREYFNVYHREIHKNVKAWCCYVALKSYKHDKTTESDVISIINDFIEYYNDKHQKYIEDIVSYTTEFDRDIEFVNMFFNKKGG